VLIARSAPECHLYMDLHPCSCGQADDKLGHRVVSGGDGQLVAVYEGICSRCGRPRRFDFTLDPAIPPPPPAFGGRAPSQIICPGQFSLVAQHCASAAPGDTTALAGAEWRRARALLSRALAAQEEIIKFVPRGAEAVPPQAFTSAEGQRLYVREPGRFDEFRLAAVAQYYRETLASLDQAA
jgi:hypothetical protein